MNLEDKEGRRALKINTNEKGQHLEVGTKLDFKSVFRELLALESTVFQQFSYFSEGNN